MYIYEKVTCLGDVGSLDMSCVDVDCIGIDCLIMAWFGSSREKIKISV